MGNPKDYDNDSNIICTHPIYYYLHIPQVGTVKQPHDDASPPQKIYQWGVKYGRKGKTLYFAGQCYGCVCILPNMDGTVSRGISICSPKDRFSKKIAREIAFNRMLATESRTRLVGKGNTFIFLSKSTQKWYEIPMTHRCSRHVVKITLSFPHATPTNYERTILKTNC